jgi:hypothetical protein
LRCGQRHARPQGDDRLQWRGRKPRCEIPQCDCSPFRQRRSGDERADGAVANEPFKAALESTLAFNGYLAQSGTPKFYLDAEIQNLDQPIMRLDFDVVADVTYKVSGGAGAPAVYPIKAKGTATFSDSVIGVDRIRIANESAMRENLKQFLEALRGARVTCLKGLAIEVVADADGRRAVPLFALAESDSRGQHPRHNLAGECA